MNLIDAGAPGGWAASLPDRSAPLTGSMGRPTVTSLVKGTEPCLPFLKFYFTRRTTRVEDINDNNDR